MKTLVLGLGNPILSDDSVGMKIAQVLQDIVHDAEVTIIESSSSGLNLLQLLIDYDRAIIIDAIQTKRGQPGCIYHFEPSDLKTSERVTHCHSSGIADMIRLGKQLGLKLPQKIDIFAVEAADISTFSEELNPEVAKAVSVCSSIIVKELGSNIDSSKIMEKTYKQ